MQFKNALDQKFNKIHYQQIFFEQQLSIKYRISFFKYQFERPNLENVKKKKAISIGKWWKKNQKIKSLMIDSQLKNYISLFDKSSFYYTQIIGFFLNLLSSSRLRNYMLILQSILFELFYFFLSITIEKMLKSIYHQIIRFANYFFYRFQIRIQQQKTFLVLTLFFITKNMKQVSQTNIQQLKFDTSTKDYAWQNITLFLKLFSNSINGIRNIDYDHDSISTEIRYELSRLYKDQYQSVATVKLTDRQIQNELIKFPGYNSTTHAFQAILNRQFRKLYAPAYESNNKIHKIMEKQAINLINTVMIARQYSELKTKFQQIVKKVLEQHRQKLQLSLNSLIQAQISYLYTNDDAYIKKDFSLKNQDKHKPSYFKMQLFSFVFQFRKRIDCYYNIVVRNLKDYVPKHIFSSLTVKFLNQLQFEAFEFAANFSKQYQRNSQINLIK